MADVFRRLVDLVGVLVDALCAVPLSVLFLGFGVLLLLAVATAYLLLCFCAPKPRLSFPSEKTYRTSDPKHGVVTRPLPCWYDRWLAERHLATAAAAATSSATDDRNKDPENKNENKNENTDSSDSDDEDLTSNSYDLNVIEPAEVGLTVVVPAYNESLRILPALEEMVAYCDKRFGRPDAVATKEANAAVPNGNTTMGVPPTEAQRPTTPSRRARAAAALLKKLRADDHDHDHDVDPFGDELSLPGGYEILVVDDASTDDTARVVLEFARARGLHDVVRVVSLAQNRGKGGGVTHGFRHARGAYVAFADADGASRRAHLVGSAAVVQRSALRNFLMQAFHFVLTILTPPATSRIRDTQCGFKLFSRAALPHIVPYMHTEGWIFDIEMLMLAESAPASPVVAPDGTVVGTSAGIKVAEVPIGWHEVPGSKMNLVQDSVRMAVGLTVLRASWMLGVYRRRVA
ncbi:dolichyl-phosphate beta-transferase [Niveomyces insectorum RCEF 264]|uniref:dolichyl-phosphate beta-glucosyltransferase n=1 Tax=Niveomyces insectorum RCEF 264 TaxID=1081102 RepID=A0A167WWV0_9HYPO|nr:dolichyl-phosphate beta-transferase [Niveomyces insectorum RCEF 264]